MRGWTPAQCRALGVDELNWAYEKDPDHPASEGWQELF